MTRTTLTRAAQPRAGAKRNRARKLVFAFFIFIGGVVFLESPLTRVRVIQVTGNTSVPANRILAASDLHDGISLWQVNGAKLEQAVLAHEPLVQAVDVRTDYFSGRVTLVVREKHVVALLEHTGAFYHLLDDGTVYTAATAQEGFPWPIVTADGVVSTHIGSVASADIAQVCAGLKGLSVALAAQISEVHVDSLGIATIYLTNHFAAQCKVADLPTVMAGIQSAIEYFTGKGYAPGLIDMTGGPPYRYTPFQSATVKENHP